MIFIDSHFYIFYRKVAKVNKDRKEILKLYDSFVSLQLNYFTSE